MGDKMITKIQHLLNLDIQRFITMGGLQGSGKSTIVTEFENVGYKVVCPDRIRVELAKKKYGDNKLEGELVGVLQDFESQVWTTAQTRVNSYLKAGDSVIFDATNTTVKARKQLLAWGRQNHIPVTAIYVECPLEIALQRNEKRGATITGTDINGNPIYGRSVPDFVIRNKWQTQVLPTCQEGFTEVYTLHVGLEKNKNNDWAKEMFCNMIKSPDLLVHLTNLHENGILKDLIPLFDVCWGLDQENKYHNLPLHEHMIKAADYVKGEDLALFIATLIHDIGKFPTKKKYGKTKFNSLQFKIGEKVEVLSLEQEGFIKAYRLDYRGEVSELMTIKHVELDPNSHYYGHELVGSIMARRAVKELGFDDEFADLIYQYVLYYMDLPYQTFSEKSMEKLINKVGKPMVWAMVKLKKADKNASASNDINQYLENFKKIEDMLN